MGLPKISAIHQILPQLTARDAIGTEVLLIQKLLRNKGFKSDIFFDEAGDKSIAHHLDKLQPADDGSTVCLYHFSVGSSIPFKLLELGHRIWCRYHNITPGYFFNKPAEKPAQIACNLGRRQIPLMGLLSEAILAGSTYNLAELSPHTSAETSVIPIFRDYDQLRGKASSAQRFIKSDGRKNILFVGRICPNKAQHELIELVALDKRFGSKNSRLILVGGFYSHDFKDAIVGFAHDLGLTVSIGRLTDWSADVIIPGSISDDEMAACYRDSDAFVSLSDHEGFGVPLVEAMSFGLPVLAHHSSAVTETLGPAGLIVNKSERIGLLQNLQSILNNETLRLDLKRKGLKRFQDLSLETASDKLLQFVHTFL